MSALDFKKFFAYQVHHHFEKLEKYKVTKIFDQTNNKQEHFLNFDNYDVKVVIFTQFNVFFDI